MGYPANDFSSYVGPHVNILTFQLHVKDLNETIRYMYEHKMYQKVTSALGVAWWGRSVRKAGDAEPTPSLTPQLQMAVFWRVSLGSVLTTGFPGFTLSDSRALAISSEYWSSSSNAVWTPPTGFDSEAWGEA